MVWQLIVGPVVLLLLFGPAIFSVFKLLFVDINFGSPLVIGVTIFVVLLFIKKLK